MGLHPGSLATAPLTTLPSEVIRVLGKLALGGASAHVHIRSGVDSLLGDTHLVVVGGKLHVVARKSSLDPLEDVPLLALPEIDETGYRSILQLRTPMGDKRVEVGATEENAVHALVDALGPDALEVAEAAQPARPETEAPWTDAPRDPELDASRAHLLGVVEVMRGDEALRDRDAVRAAFLGVLVTRLRQRKAKLRADRDAYERAAKAKPRPKPTRAVALRAEVGVATKDEDGDGVPDPPDGAERRVRPPPRDAMSPLQFLLALGLAAAIVVFAVAAFLGKR